jgi:RNA polymerase sigma-70 factor (ECF subfamily)
VGTQLLNMTIAASASSPTGSSDSLVARLKLRDALAWERLSQLFGPVVYGWARRAGLQDSDAADVTQEVFHAVAQQIDAFRKEQPGDSFRGWLWGITRHKILDQFRKRASQPDAIGGSGLVDQTIRLIEQPPDQDEEGNHAALVQRALALIQTDFEQTTWQAFVQLVMEGRTAAQVAAELHLTLGAVYTAKSRVLARLRQELDDLL